ncbi:MAG TPA: competence/damage-inducible protein A [Bacteroidetes bacterium]|nr:competence/damage-inducible protein A [Bacteroidota bacterium]HRK06029.1 competence/damage-inducible protein A [Chlorobiota bacterium]
MNIAIVSIGDEILIGQIVNSNAAWMAESIVNVGGRIIEHVVVADDEEHLVRTLDRLRPESDVIIMTGGLGPTHDDITKPVVARYTNDKIVERPEVVEFLQNFMAQRGRTLTDRNRLQALAPSRATVLMNAVGTAPGLRFDLDDGILFCLPGVPTEMRYLMSTFVLPLIEERVAEYGDAVTEYYVIRTTGIVESNLADLLGDPQQLLEGASLAFLPNYHGVRLRLGVTDTDAERRRDKQRTILSRIRERAGRYIYAEGDVSLAEAVGRQLARRSETVSVAESCTGGLLGAALTETAGSSAWFIGGIQSYANEVKTRELGVDTLLLESFGAVSEQVAIAMAVGARQRFETTWSLSITGIAGPDGGSRDKPVGTVWIGIAGPDTAIARRYQFGDRRDVNRERSVGAALALLFEYMRMAQ